MKLDADPLQKKPDADHPYAWYYGNQFMGFLTYEAYLTRQDRYATNRSRMHGQPSSEASVFLEDGKRLEWKLRNA